LHASKLSFIHPVLNKEIVLIAGLDEVFEKVVSMFSERRV
jgi:hypothetical protein